MTNKLKTLFFFVVVTALGVAAVFWLYPKVHPLAGIKQTMDRKMVRLHARNIVKELGFEDEGYEVSIRFGSDRDLIRQAQAVLGLQESNRVFREGLPVHHWRVDWHKAEATQPPRGRPGGRDPDVESIIASLLGNLSVTFDMRGHLLSLTSNVADTVSLPGLDEQDARKLAEDFITNSGSLTLADEQMTDESARQKKENASDFTRISPLRLEEQQKTIGHTRTDYQFSYVANDAYLNNEVRVTVLVSGNMILRFDVDPVVPEQFTGENDNVLSETTKVISILAFIIVVSVIGFKRIRAYEIGFRTALVFGIVVAVSFGLTIYMQMRGSSGWEMLPALTLAPFFIGVVFTIVWAVTEAVGREVWKDKFSGIDLLANGYFSHSKIGEGLLRGIALGLAFSGIWLVLLFLLSHVAKIFIFPFQDQDNFLSAGNPALFLVNDEFGNNAFKVVLFVTLAVSLLRRLGTPTTALVALTAVIWGFNVQGDIHPWYLGIPVEMVMGGLLTVTFIRFDFITLFISLLTFTVSDLGTAFFYFENPSSIHSGYGMLLFMVALTAVGFVFLLTKDKISDFDRITPAFVQHVTERQRLQSELAVAREVQMSFLPAHSPNIAGLEIASECLPAKEVGGDYYDFIELGKNRLGVVIGDVSGKGTQAAFYMTLTKGFLKALAHTTPSPAGLLIQMNQLFYENVARGHFISLVYAIFDLETRTATIARAGHNPIVVNHSASNRVAFFDQPGMAMGLEKGDIFKESIRDKQVSFAEGELFVFYTDGLTEAMNKKKEEFGEQRFLESITKWSNGSAAELQKGVFEEVKEFIGKAPQQDDMTMVIVKIV